MVSAQPSNKQDPFSVCGSYSQSNGWKITVYVEGSGRIKEPTTTPTAIAIAAAPEREDITALLDPEEISGDMEEGNADDPEEIDSAADTKKRRHKSPIKSRWLVPLVKLAIAEKPNISNKDLCCQTLL